MGSMLDEKTVFGTSASARAKRYISFAIRQKRLPFFAPLESGIGPAAVTLDRVSSTSIEGTADQIGFRR
jgi:hypothetical protein